MNEDLLEWMKPRHIGDGVYVSFDGYHINLAVNHHNNHVAALDPDVSEALVNYIKSVAEALRNRKTE